MYNNWPPAYKVRISKRARRILLKVSPRSGLEVIVPHIYRSHHDITSLLSEHRQWIENQLFKFNQTEIQNIELPKEISLQAVAKVYNVDYQPNDAKKTLVEVETNHLIIQGDYTQNDVPILLKNWLFNKAKELLPELLEFNSIECKLPYHSVSVKKQKTRWGSCTIKKVINLNYLLLLLPPKLTRYVIIHELCHTKELNHSKQFWDLVANFVPDWPQYRQQLRQHRQLLPAWVLE